MTATVHERGYWVGKDNLPHAFDVRLADALCEMLQGRSVADMGCGLGQYVSWLVKAGVKAIGYDGNPDTDVIANQYCFHFDITEQARLPIFDWVLSLEVLEHIPAEFEELALNTICNHAGQGIVLSWAVPGQGGLGHFNCRPRDYVEAIMAARGFMVDHAASESLREVALLSWFKNNLLVLKRSET